MSKEELLKYLIAEIDLIMHDKDYRFENANGTWYSRESCRDLTNEEVLEELRTELRQFADLEAKLEEKDEQIKRRIAVYEKQFIEQTNENCELKQQLAEKDKEIERLNLEFETQEDWQEKWQKLYDETCNLTQDKISFAVEQLEKVKECLKEEIEDVKILLDPIEYEDYHELLGVGRGYRNSIEIIDNQIEELKKEIN